MEATALVVDDDPAVRLLVRESLEAEGLRVVDCGDGLRALVAYVQHRPDLVLLDVMMPHLDGLQTCASLRALPGAEDVPIVMMTGADDVQRIHEAYEAGATDFITKPMSYVVLPYRVQYLLRASRTAMELRRSQERLAGAQRLARLGHWELDPESERLRASAECCRIFDLPGNESAVPLRRLLERVHAEDRPRVEGLFQALVDDDQPFALEHRLSLADGTERFVHLRAETSASTGRRMLAGTAQDVTASKSIEDKLFRLAHFDPVTSLPNRRFVQGFLERCMGLAVRRHHSMALLALDIDNFKRINDSLGHAAGDRLLKELSARLLGCLRNAGGLALAGTPDGATGPASDTVARLGGDEFLVILPQIRQGQDAAVVARRMQGALASPFTIEGQDVVVSVSVGISIFPDNGDSEALLLKNADAALTAAKKAGRNNYQFYSSQMNALALERLTLERDLRSAIDGDQLALHYQPKVDILKGEIVGMEALLRWSHPERGPMSPGAFIPVAEDSGLILPMGRWVLRTALGQTKKWHDAGLSFLNVAINISGRQFKEPDFLESVRRIVTQSGVDPSKIELEITEGVLMEDTARSASVLAELKGLGLRVALDDFGTGYSSLSYLKRFPIDTVKIDRAFVKDVAADHDNAAIVDAIISMARSMGLGAVAEGVETPEELAFLHERGCAQVQGFLFSRPLPAEDFAAWASRGELSLRPLEDVAAKSSGGT